VQGVLEKKSCLRVVFAVGFVRVGLLLWACSCCTGRKGVEVVS
jgi:hypothetical protein